MAKVKMQVFVEPQTLKIFEELAEAADIPVTRAMADMLDEAAPKMQGVAKVLREARKLRLAAPMNPRSRPV
jgi:hypothetical protein